MDIAGRIDSFAPFAALAQLWAGVAWFGVARAAGRKHSSDVFTMLAGASYLTGTAFLLIFAAYLGR